MEITFDIDVHNVTCGGNAALFFTQMPTDYWSTGGGYCDAFGGNNGTMHCPEMDIVESNAYATAVTTHPCTTSTSGCDGDGCQINPFLMGNPDFYGPGSSYTIDTTKKNTVITQFIANGTDLVEIRRFYKVGDRVIQTPVGTNEDGVYGYQTINATMCPARHGGIPKMGQQLNNQVFIISFWSDEGNKHGMDWLDEGDNGPCSGSNFNQQKASVSFGNLRIGPVGTTLLPTTSSSTTSSTTKASTTATPTTTTTKSATSSPTTSSPTPAPTSGTPAPTSGTPAPTSGTPAPTSGTPAPTSGTPAPTSGTPSPTSGTPAPTSGTPAPTSGTPAPTSGTPAPTSGTPAPTQAPSTSTPTTDSTATPAPSTTDGDAQQNGATRISLAFGAVFFCAMLLAM